MRIFLLDFFTEFAVLLSFYVCVYLLTGCSILYSITCPIQQFSDIWCDSDQTLTMQVSVANDVKVYNLSAGKSVPEVYGIIYWLL